MPFGLYAVGIVCFTRRFRHVTDSLFLLSGAKTTYHCMFFVYV
mgnify:CR=1 FL=1